MENSTKLPTVYDDFFGNIVGSSATGTDKTNAPRPAVDFVNDWSISGE